MPIPHTQTRHTFSKRLIVSLAIVALQIQAFSPALAALSQKPLLASASSIPKPNLMLTLDTSGSMNFRHMPESSSVVNGATLPMVGEYTYVHHRLDTYSAGTNFKGEMTADINLAPESDALKRQIYFRSPDVNTIYYNPRELYKPWGKAGGGRHDPAKIEKAYINPTNQIDSKGAWINLTETLQDVNKIDNFWPGIYYLLKPNTSKDDTPKTASYDLFDVNNPAVKTYSNYKDTQGKTKRTDCISSPSHCTQKEEQQNFANWFVYYRTRMLLTKAALSETFYKIDDMARLGWTTLLYARTKRLAEIDSDTNKRAPILQTVQPLDPLHRDQFITDLQTTSNFMAGDSTPLRQALDSVGRYFTDDTANSPWTDDKATTKSACRRSYNILTTDGYYNNDQLRKSQLVGNLDNSTPASRGDQNSYTATTPYQDDFSNTLADFALKYWMTDLQPLVDNSVKATTEDPAIWQHLTQLTISIGVAGTLDPKTDLPLLTNGTKTWPDPSRSDPAKIDDLWHAAVNSRGQFYQVKNSNELKEAIVDAISNFDKFELNEGGVSFAGTTEQSSTRRYVPSYDGNTWVGELRAYSVDTNGITSKTASWEASKRVPDFSTRNLYSSKPNGSTSIGTIGIPFKSDSFGGDDLAILGGPGAADLIEYIRGDTSKEGIDSDQFRKRKGKLADFINPPPVFIKDSINLKYGNLSTGGSQYQAHLDKKGMRSSGVLFAGGNGGFLHGFGDSLSEPALSTDGVEVYGYAPRGVLPNLYKLAQQSYGKPGRGNEHQFFVDGPLVESDAYTTKGSTTAWRNVLVGSLGGGGKGLYALDVTNLDEGVAGLGQNSVLWDATLPSEADVGHIFSDPAIGPMSDNGAWVALSGNGYDSASGRAALLAYDMNSGEVSSLKTGIDGDVGNGLGGLTVVRNPQQEIIGAYAGDLKGNLWRFELDNQGKWIVGYSGNPVFKASTDAKSQPITAAPAVIPHPAGGYMIVFGTGKLLEAEDRTNTEVQSVYGIWDDSELTADTSNTLSKTNTTVARTDGTLVQQTITEITIDGQTVFNVSSNAQDTGGQKTRGWYLDLNVLPAGQRVIYPVQRIFTSQYVLIESVAPSSTAAECEPPKTGSGINLILPGLSGAQGTRAIIDHDGDGVITDKDGPYAGRKTSADGRNKLRLKENPKNPDPHPPKECAGSDDGAYESSSFDLCPKHRVLDRVWKRIVNVPQPAATPK